MRYLFPSHTARLSSCIPKSENETQPVVLAGNVLFPAPETKASPVRASIEFVSSVELHIVGTRQIAAYVQASELDGAEDEAAADELPESVDRDVRLPHSPLYVNT